VAIAAGCGSSASTGSGPLTLGVLQPYTGSLASYGPEGSEICYVAAKAINDGGGVMGRKVACHFYDSGSDPSDEVPIGDRMIASASNLAMVFGPPVDLPLEASLDNSKVVHFTDDGDPRLDHQASPYFYRVNPSDSAGGAVYALMAYTHGYRHIAGVFTNTQNAQTVVPALRKTYPALGGTFPTFLSLAPDQPSYRVEAERVLAAKPDAIVIGTDAQTAATFLSEMLQLNSGKLPPVIAVGIGGDNTWIPAVVHAIGAKRFVQYLTDIDSLVPQSGAAYNYWKHELLTAHASIPNRQQWLTDAYSQYYYDAFVLGALAMTKAKSTDPAKWASLVREIANGSPGAVVVNTYAAGRQALAAGKQIHYVGASGPIFFNQWHNDSGLWASYRYKTTGASSVAPFVSTVVTPAQIARVQR
jgi:ABC-type branched-subunit amino acid transport system substrate-binding protein